MKGTAKLVNLKSTLVFALLFSLLTTVPVIPQANAATPVIVHKSTCSTLTEFCTITLAILSGDEIVVGGGEECTEFGGFLSLTDNQRTNFTIHSQDAVCESGTPSGDSSAVIAYGKALDTNTDTISIRFDGYVCDSFSPCLSGGIAFDVSRWNGPTSFVDGQCNVPATCPSTALTSSASWDPLSGPFLFSVVSNYGGAGGTPGLHFEQITGSGFQWNTTGAIAPPTDYPMSTSSTYGYAAVGLGSLVVPPTVQACNFFQLQCWWFPMLIFGVYAGFFMIIGGIGKVGAKGMNFLLFGSLTFAGMIEVLMGMISIMIPLILAVLVIVYAVRT